MTQFHSQEQAKEYLIGRIVAEAGRERVVLSDVERKRLYFSETDWAPPGMLDVNAEFERDYDNDAYEEKIAGLVRNLLAGTTLEEQAAWHDAVLKLSEGDHYLLVLIDGAGQSARGGTLGKLGPWLPSVDPRVRRPPGDLKRLVIVALSIAGLLLFAAIIATYVQKMLR